MKEKLTPEEIERRVLAHGTISPLGTLARCAVALIAKNDEITVKGTAAQRAGVALAVDLQAKLAKQRAAAYRDLERAVEGLREVL